MCTTASIVQAVLLMSVCSGLCFSAGQQGHDVRALYSYKPRHNGQVAMEVGDLLGIAGNEKDGTSKGMHHKSNKYGEFFSYLVEEVPIVTDFPTYPGIWDLYIGGHTAPNAYPMNVICSLSLQIIPIQISLI